MSSVGVGVHLQGVVGGEGTFALYSSVSVDQLALVDVVRGVGGGDGRRCCTIFWWRVLVACELCPGLFDWHASKTFTCKFVVKDPPWPAIDLVKDGCVDV